MLTHTIQYSKVSLFLIDELDIYLHSDLQRLLMTMLRCLGPDIVFATYSTEIITEAEAEDIVVINKLKSRPVRLKDATQLEEVFKVSGSNVNPIMTQLAKTRRIVFLEGKDFQILGRFASKLGQEAVAGRTAFAVVPVEGFSPDRMRTSKKGMEVTLGLNVSAAAILDRHYRSLPEVEYIQKSLLYVVKFSIMHNCKEIENFLLVPGAIDRAARARLRDRKARTGSAAEYEDCAISILDDFCKQKNPISWGNSADSDETLSASREAD